MVDYDFEENHEHIKADLKDTFPMRAVHHLARCCSCHCQSNAIEVEQNAHRKSCMVGQAQAFLGDKVTWIEKS